MQNGIMKDVSGFDNDFLEDPWTTGKFLKFCHCLGLSTKGFEEEMLSC